MVDLIESRTRKRLIAAATAKAVVDPAWLPD